ncbi:MAG: hypothetical protein MPJ50_04140 [Pirellulales bacterium]|nr:hypothetical protein [Pirellulales bacterium]
MTESQAQRAHCFWQLLRDHPWVARKLSQSVDTAENRGFRDELSFRLTLQLAPQSSGDIAKLTLREFCHMLKAQRSAAAKFLRPLAVVAVSDLDAMVETQQMIDRLPPLPRTALTLRLKGISVEHGAALLRISVFAFYSAWREGALEIQKNLCAP